MYSHRWALTGALFAAAQFVAGHAMAAETVRFLTNETAPLSIAFFNKAIAEFEKQNPDIKIQLEPISTDGRLQKVMASISTRTMPGLMKILPEERYDLAKNGYIVPLDDVVSDIGESDFVPGSLAKIGGKVYDIPYTLGNFGNLWYRTDLLKAAGLEPPKDWDQLRTDAQKLTTDGRFGYVFPAGKNRQTTNIFASLIWSAGGTFFDKDLNVTFDNPGTVKALALLKDLAKSSPPGIGSYSGGELDNAYLSGQVAMELYAATSVSTGISSKSDIVPKTSVAPAPIGPAGIGAKFVAANCYAVGAPKVGAQSPEAAKKFLKFLLSKQQLADFSLTNFPHLIPPLRSIQKDVAERGAPLLGGRIDMAYTAFDTTNGLDFDSEAGATVKDGKLIRSGVLNPYIGPVIARGIPATVLQRVILNGEAPEAAAKWGADQMRQVVQDLKSQ